MNPAAYVNLTGWRTLMSELHTYTDIHATTAVTHRQQLRHSQGMIAGLLTCNSAQCTMRQKQVHDGSLAAASWHVRSQSTYASSQKAPMHQTRITCVQGVLLLCCAAKLEWSSRATLRAPSLFTRASAEQPTARCLTSSRLQGTVPVQISLFNTCAIHNCMQMSQAMQTQFCLLISSVHRCSAHLVRKHRAAWLCAKVYIEVRVERHAALLVVNIDLRA